MQAEGCEIQGSNMRDIDYIVVEGNTRAWAGGGVNVKYISGQERRGNLLTTSCCFPVLSYCLSCHVSYSRHGPQ